VTGVAVRVQVRGRVQGVGYRASLCAVATRHGLCGWVRNRSDGSVEAVLLGPQAEVAAVRAWMHRGPPGARVDDVEARPATPGELALVGDGFEPLPTR
jgi:acylphosphatase